MPKLTSNSDNTNYDINAINNKVMALKLMLSLGNLSKMKKMIMDNGQVLLILKTRAVH